MIRKDAVPAEKVQASIEQVPNKAIDMRCGPTPEISLQHVWPFDSAQLQKARKSMNKDYAFSELDRFGELFFELMTGIEAILGTGSIEPECMDLERATYYMLHAKTIPDRWIFFSVQNVYYYGDYNRMLETMGWRRQDLSEYYDEDAW